MKRLKRILRHFPALYELASLIIFLVEEAWFAAWVWMAPKRFMDQSHRSRSWNFETPDCQEFHYRVLSVLTDRIGLDRWGDALEVGCSEGVFTSYLASRCRSVLACDISPVARQRAAERCLQYPNVCVGLLDLARDEVKGQYDLIFVMDILSCIRGRNRLASAVKKLETALRDGGVLIYTDNSMPLDILRSWGSHRWWSSFLAMMEPDDCVHLLKTRCRLQLVWREQYLPDLKGGRDNMIALLQKPTAIRGKTDPGSVDRLVVGMVPPRS